MNQSELPELSNLLSCYFHQDFYEEFSDDQAALSYIVEHESADYLEKASSQISDLLGRQLDSKSLGNVLFEVLGCCYDSHADGVSHVEWLERMRARLQASR